MKQITEEIKLKIWKSHCGVGKSFHWNDLYDTEEELINDMFNEKVKTEGYYQDLVRGYEFIKGFRQYFSMHGNLTEKQMVQLKRLAPEIAFRIYC